MAVKLKLTRLPHLNDTIVIKQEGGHYFIAAPDSIIIDKEGLLKLIETLVYIEYITPQELNKIHSNLYMERMRRKYAKDKKDSSNISIG